MQGGSQKKASNGRLYCKRPAQTETRLNVLHYKNARAILGKLILIYAYFRNHHTR